MEDSMSDSMMGHANDGAPGNEDPLAAMWLETQAPARDLHFELSVDQRIARRLMLVDGAGLAVAVGAGGVAVWGFWPAALRILEGLTEGFGAAGPMLAAAAAASAAVFWLIRPRAI
jgi:hypothetical protein